MNVLFKTNKAPPPALSRRNSDGKLVISVKTLILSILYLRRPQTFDFWSFELLN